MTTTIQAGARKNAASSPNPNRGASILAPLNDIAARSSSLVANHEARFTVKGQPHELARYFFIGPKGGDRPIRLGIRTGKFDFPPARTTHGIIPTSRNNP